MVAEIAMPYLAAPGPAVARHVKPSEHYRAPCPVTTAQPGRDMPCHAAPSRNMPSQVPPRHI